MPWGVAAAAVGVGTGIASARASERAADVAAEGAERSAAQIQGAADVVRFDVNRLFPLAQQDLLAGAGAAGDILSQGVTEQQRLLSAGNIGAQQTLGQGFGNIEASLLGTPINRQAFVPQGVQQQPLAQAAQQQPLQQPAQQQIALSQPIANPLAGGGQAAGLGGGLFTDLTADRNIDALISAGRGGVTNTATTAQRQLLKQGLDFEGRPIGEFEENRQRDKLNEERISRLVNRVGTDQGGTADTKAAENRLKELGIKPSVARLLNRVQTGKGGAADIDAAINRLKQLGFTSTGLRG